MTQESRQITTKIAYLTNGCCEAANPAHEALFAQLGLAHSMHEEQFYPLTESETRFIAEDLLPLGPNWALIGYSALHNGKKYLAPTVEFQFCSDSANDFTKAQAKEQYDAFKPLLEALAEITDGYFLHHDEPAIEFDVGDGFYSAELLIPFAYAQAQATDLASWCEHLETLGRNAAIELGMIQTKAA